MEVPLSPGCVGRFGFGPVAGLDQPIPNLVGIIDMEHRPAPEGNLVWMHEQVDEVLSEPQRRELGFRSTELDCKAKSLSVEPQGSGHVGDSEGEGVDLHQP